MTDNRIVFDKANFRMENGVLFCEFNNKDVGHRLQEESVHHYIKAASTLCEGNPTPFLINLQNTKGTYTINAAKLFANSPELKLIRIAEAYVLSSTAMKLLISAYKRIYEPRTPFIIVDNLDQATTFCLDVKQKYNAVD